MSDVTLSDGRELTVDLSTFTIKEYRAMADPSQNRDEALASEDELISKALGLSLEDYQNLSFPDWRKASRAFFKKVQEPLSDPNSASASTSI